MGDNGGRAKCETCGTRIQHQGAAQRYCSRKCYTRLGQSNPFYGKSHKPETIENMKRVLSIKMAGDKNPFFGKTHTSQTIEAIKQKNREYRQNNKEAILSRQLARLNLTTEKVRSIFQEYAQTTLNSVQLQEKYKVDKRVLFKYMILLGVCTEEELEAVKYAKKYKNANSAPEQRTYELLVAKYGEESVIRNYKLGPFYYDFLLFGKILVEYDGYYWHNEVENNDERKTMLAETKGMPLYRIREPKSRKTDFIDEMKRIDEVVKNEV